MTTENDRDEIKGNQHEIPYAWTPGCASPPRRGRQHSLPQQTTLISRIKNTVIYLNPGTRLQRRNNSRTRALDIPVHPVL